MGHEVAKLRLAAERNLSIAAMRAQGSSDGQKLDSGWDRSEAWSALTGVVRRVMMLRLGPIKGYAAC